ncbi:MAG: thioredoxin family protein [Gammaproteobacteria bacterium]|nr:thioredoxin family protein [Gammaproteobacteria bacterium]
MNTKRMRVLLVILLMFLLAYFLFFKIQTYLGQQALEATGINRVELSQALILAKQQNRFILADMSAIWCPTCRKLDKEIFSKEIVKQAIAEHYIFTRIEYETDEGKQFMKTYNLKGFPTLLILDKEANMLMRLPLTFDAELFVDYLKDFIEMKTLS